MSERAFKVGDRVRVGKDPKCSDANDSWVDPRIAGKEGVIFALAAHGDYDVKTDVEWQIISPEYLTLLEPEGASDLLPARSAVLRVAEGLVNGDRQEEYGTPAVNLGRIAALWSVIFAREVTKSEVALALAALKIARLVQTPGSRDGWTDLAGYAAIGAEVSEA